LAAITIDVSPGAVEFADAWQSERFDFHHGHCAAGTSDRIQIIGHHHPAGTVRDGAGLRLKFPAFVQQGNCWIMPAFSPWAGRRALDVRRRELRPALYAEPHPAVGI
jgi:metallophosphoesterase superfamily enzyme